MITFETEGEIFRDIFKRLDSTGQDLETRGLKTRECINFSYQLPSYVRFCNFIDRKLNIEYIKKEFLWYLRADPTDLSICNYASLWRTLINESGEFKDTILSNYGVPIFRVNQFDRVVEMLKEDPNSRKASIMILRAEHVISKEVKEIPCTYSLNFKIRNNELIMSVVMRSQDSIFGLGNDCPTFSFVQEMIYTVLRDTYPDLIMGQYYHMAESFHIYEKHYKMLDKIVNGSKFIPIEVPRIKNSAEVTLLKNLNGLTVDQIPKEYQFTRWLLEHN